MILIHRMRNDCGGIVVGNDGAIKRSPFTSTRLEAYAICRKYQAPA